MSSTLTKEEVVPLSAVRESNIAECFIFHNK